MPADRFAAYLRSLKRRSGRGFDQLGRQIGVSGSSLHRYCSGVSVPPDYWVVQAFARVCAADQDELRELERLWTLANESRDTAPTATPPTPETPAPPTPAVPAPPGDAGDTSPGGATRPTAARRLTRPALAVVIIAVVALVRTVGAGTGGTGERPAQTGDASAGLLFSAVCQPTVSMGEHSACVAEVQTLLARAGARLSIDGTFGPETLRRVTAFQVLAGLPPGGVVDQRTKTALYDQKVSMRTWPPEQVEQRIREVFREDPDHAVAIARCQSFLDPLWVLPNTDGTSNWGVFQISDRYLTDLGGTPLQAYDPDWNIRAAHRLWSVHRDFRNWPACDAALGGAGPAVSPSAAATSSPGFDITP